MLEKKQDLFDLDIKDYLRFLDMDDESVKSAFVQWLTELAIKHDWIDKDGKPIHRRLAIYLGVSSQAVTNWLDKVGYPSSQMINNIIAPKCGITPARFWHELQMIDRKLKGIVVLSEDEQQAYLESGLREPQTGKEVLDLIQKLPLKEQQLVTKALLTNLVSQYN